MRAAKPRAAKPRRVRRCRSEHQCGWCLRQGYDTLAEFIEVDNWVSMQSYCAECLEGVGGGFELVE